MPIPKIFVQPTNCGMIYSLCSPTSPSRFVRSAADVVALRLLACPRPPKNGFGVTRPFSQNQPLVEEPHTILPLSLHCEHRPCKAEHPHVCALSRQDCREPGNRSPKWNDSLPKRDCAMSRLGAYGSTNLQVVAALLYRHSWAFPRFPSSYRRRIIECIDRFT